MASRSRSPLLSKSFQRSMKALARAGTAALGRTLKVAARAAPARPGAFPARRRAPAAVRSLSGEWTPGIAFGAAGARRYHLFRPATAPDDGTAGLVVMLHGCDQDATGFADSTRMNRLAAQHGFYVLYPEQDRLANPHGCWNWFDTRSGRAQAEAGVLMAAIDQVCLFQRIHPGRIGVAGLSAGAGMAALLATRHPGRFSAVVMHSGVAPGLANSSASALAAMRGQRHAAEPFANPLHPLPPLLVIQGRADSVVSPRNGRLAARLWADAAGAEPGAARRVQRGQRHAMQLTDFHSGKRLAATLCEIAPLGHAWSGGAAGQPYGDARGPDASRLAWAFVSRAFAEADRPPVQSAAKQ